MLTRLKMKAYLQVEINLDIHRIHGIEIFVSGKGFEPVHLIGNSNKSEKQLVSDALKEFEKVNNLRVEV